MVGKPGFAGCLVVLALCAGPVDQGRAETFVEHNAEFRMQLDFVVPDAALRKFLPGPAKDFNLCLIFIDRIDITRADGQPTGSSRLVDLAVPVKQSGSATVGQMIIAGLTADPNSAEYAAFRVGCPDPLRRQSNLSTPARHEQAPQPR